jgi:transitional endoplasmic reticulum ATPase
MEKLILSVVAGCFLSAFAFLFNKDVAGVIAAGVLVWFFYGAWKVLTGSFRPRAEYSREVVVRKMTIWAAFSSLLVALSFWGNGLAPFLYFWFIASALIAFKFFSYYGSNKNEQVARASVSRGDVADQEQVPISNIEHSRITFADVDGMEETKARLLKAGQRIVNSYKNFDHNKLPIRNGILMFGPAGTGKTYFAKALAGELGLGLIHFNFTQINSMWIGEGTGRVTQVFKEAMAAAPVVLFLDEVDTIFVNRSKVAQAEHESGRLTSALLPLIEEARAKGVVLVAATNLIDNLDPAAIRDGRFDYKIEIGYPDVQARISLFSKALKDNAVNADVEDIKKAATRWENYSIPRLQSVAAELSESGLNSASFDDMMAAMRTTQGRKGKNRNNVVTLSDLVLPSEQREALDSIAWRMQNIDTLEEMGGSLPTGLLFYGDPGTGKSLTASALAATAGWGFLATSGHDLTNDPDRIDELMREAAEIRPVIVFIDEAEDVFGHRTGGYGNVVTNKLLSVMDGAMGRVPDIVFVAATNDPSGLDSAATRGGRFTEKLEFVLPEAKEVAVYIERWLKDKPKLVLDGITIDGMAQSLNRVSLANVRAVLQSTANIAIAKQRTTLTIDDFNKSVSFVFGSV